MSRTSTATPISAPVIDGDLKKLMRSVEPGPRMLDTLPERLALAKQQSQGPGLLPTFGLRGLGHLLP